MVEGKLFFNIIANVSTSEVDLEPYPSGLAKVPDDRYRYIYTVIVSNQTSSVQTLALRIYKDDSMEKEVPILVPAQSTVQIISKDIPLLVVPPNRILKAVATGNLVLLATAVEE